MSQSSDVRRGLKIETLMSMRQETMQGVASCSLIATQAMYQRQMLASDMLVASVRQFVAIVCLRQVSCILLEAATQVATSQRTSCESDYVRLM